jgi:hypothetical protein
MRQLRQALAIAAGIVFGAIAADAFAQYQPWDQVGISTNADLNVSVPVPRDSGARNYRIWQNGRVRWGWVETESTGDWRQWDSNSGWSSGRIEVEE